MLESNNHFRTADTSKAAYLISDGFPDCHIEYELKNNGKHRGVFVFKESADDPLILAAENKFDMGNAYPNILIYEKIRDNLIDRIKGGKS